MEARLLMRWWMSLQDFLVEMCLYRIDKEHTLYSVCLTEAFDNDLMYKTLKDIVEGGVVEVQTYDFVTHSR